MDDTAALTKEIEPTTDCVFRFELWINLKSATAGAQLVRFARFGGAPEIVVVVNGTKIEVESSARRCFERATIPWLPDHDEERLLLTRARPSSSRRRRRV